jgi:hypothetical protein
MNALERSNTTGPLGPETLQSGGMDAKEIFELIVKADERLKYATPAKADARKAQARDLLVQALEEARAIGNDELVEQAEIRLADLG